MTLLSSNFFGVRAISAVAIAGRSGLENTPETIEELEEADWQELPKPERAIPSPWEWLFWSFFMCMAIAALPLVGIRWTTPEGTLTAGALEDVVLLALPVVIPLPFLFLGCVGVLAFNAASRTPAAFAAFGVAMFIGFAALHALIV